MPEFASYAHGTPCWVDVTTPDLARTHAFYGALFGWEPQDRGEQARGYATYALAGRSVAAAGPPPRGREDDPPHWTTYVASDDVDATAARIREHGGTVFVEPFDVFDSGRTAVAADPTGAAFGVWEARAHVGAELANEPGTLTWNECRSPDPAAAAAFYAAVFGHTVAEFDTGGPQPYRVLQVDGRGIAGVAGVQAGEPPGWATVFAVEDADDAAARTRELGGAVVTEPFDLPGVGRYAVLRDPVGAVFGALSPPA